MGFQRLEFTRPVRVPAMFHEAYTLATLAEPPELLGRKLLPFTLGHADLLQVFESPFLVGGDWSHKETIFALWICTRSRADALAQLRSGDCTREMRVWGGEVVGYDVAEVSRALDAYISEFMAAPPRWDAKKKDPVRAPWPRQMMAALRLHFKCSADEAWNTPCHEAFCQIASVGALHGDESLMDERAIALQRIATEAARGR